MKTRLALCGLGAAALAAMLVSAGGCGDEGGDSESDQLKAQVRKLSDENTELKRQIFQANHKVGIEQDEGSGLRADLTKLQKEHGDLMRD